MANVVLSFSQHTDTKIENYTSVSNWICLNHDIDDWFFVWFIILILFAVPTRRPEKWLGIICRPNHADQWTMDQSAVDLKGTFCRPSTLQIRLCVDYTVNNSDKISLFMTCIWLRTLFLTIFNQYYYLFLLGVVGSGKRVVYLASPGRQLILAYSWARPAIFAALRVEGECFYSFCLTFIHFPFSPVPLFHLLCLFYLSSPFLWEMTQNDPQGLMRH